MITTDNYGFAVPLNKPELKEAIDQVLAGLRKGGQYEAMRQRWLPSSGGLAPMPAMKADGGKGVFKLGTSAVAEPFSFVDGSRNVAGFDIELATHVAQKLDMTLEVVNMDFGAMIPVLATFLGTLLDALGCWMRMSVKPVLRWPARVYIALLRGTSVLVVLMLIYYGVFASVLINPVLVAVMAFGLNFAAYAAKIFLRSGIEGVDKGQSEAGLAMGFNRVNTFAWTILPQTIRRIFPVYKGEFISLVKMTSVVGYIAIQDLTRASHIIRSRT